MQTCRNLSKILYRNDSCSLLKSSMSSLSFLRPLRFLLSSFIHIHSHFFLMHFSFPFLVLLASLSLSFPLSSTPQSFLLVYFFHSLSHSPLISPTYLPIFFYSPSLPPPSVRLHCVVSVKSVDVSVGSVGRSFFLLRPVTFTLRLGMTEKPVTSYY